MEIVSSAPSQPVVPIVELSSDDEMDKPHESDDDDEEESTPFVQTKTKPLKLPSGVVIKVEKDHWPLEEEKRVRRIARRAAREAKEKEMTNAVAACQAEMRRRQAEIDRKQESLERQIAELMARMNPQAINFKESPSAIPATVTPPSTSELRTAVPLHAAQQTELAVGDRRRDDRREAATRMDVDIVASTQEPPASITSGAAGHHQGNDTLQSRDLEHQSPASEEEPLDYEEGEQVSPTGSEEGPPQQGQSATAMDEVVIPVTEDFKVYFQCL